MASFYGPHLHGRRMANGQRFNQWAPVVASRTLPLGTRVRVINLLNGRAVAATVTDRGPGPRGRILDVSTGIANRLRMRKVGLARVSVVVLGYSN